MKKPTFMSKIIEMDNSPMNNSENNYGNVINFNKELKENTNIFSVKTLAKAQGMRLNILRKNIGLNLQEFGSLCKIEAGMLGRYERGGTEIHPACVLKICVILRSHLNVFFDPEWILSGNGICPHIINDNTELKCNTMEDSVKFYTNTYADYKTTLNVYDNKNNKSLFSSHCLVMGEDINIKEEEDLLQLDYVYCYITLTNDKNIVAIVTYSTDNEEEHNTNSENNLFIINDESSEKPYFLKKSEIKSIKRITGFYRNDKPFNLSKIA